MTRSSRSAVLQNDVVLRPSHEFLSGFTNLPSGRSGLSMSALGDVV